MNWKTAWDYVCHIDGLLDSSAGRWLFEMAQRLPDNSIILEIGAYLGYSTSCLAFGCKETRKRIYTIDTFCGNDTDFIREDDFFDTWETNIGRCGLLDYVTPLRGLSSSFYEAWDRPIHFLFIDGCHDLEVVKGDFDAFYPFVVPGGCIAVHDVPAPGDKGGHRGVYEAWYEHIRPTLRHIDQYPLAHGWKCMSV